MYQKCIVIDVGHGGRGCVVNGIQEKEFPNLKVLRELIDTYPAVLMELGFLSNRDEAIYLESEVIMNGLALLILKVFVHKN